MSKYEIGQQIQVRLSTGRVVDVQIRAIVQHRDGEKFQVDFDNQTALVRGFQIVRKPVAA
jgi:hypothetical protein